MNSKKIFIFIGVLIVMVQNLIIFSPILHPNFHIHMWGDDFVVFNEYQMTNKTINILPNSANELIDRIRGRKYLSILLREFAHLFQGSFNSMHFFFVILWIVATILIFVSLYRFFGLTVGLITTLTFNSFSVRDQVFGALQGVGYSFVLFGFSIAFLLITFRPKNRLNRMVIDFAALLFLSSTLLFYELALPMFFFFSFLTIISSKNDYGKVTILEGTKSFVWTLVPCAHLLVVATAPNPIFNRNSVDLSVGSILGNWRYLGGYYRNYIDPAWAMITGERTYLHVSTIVLNSFISHWVLIPTLFTLCFFVALLAGKKFFIEVFNFNRMKRGILVSLGAFSLSTPLLGILTFTGSFPSRLAIFGGFGVALTLGFIYVFSRILDRRAALTLQAMVSLFICLNSLVSLNQFGAIRSVSQFDFELNKSIIKTLRESADTVKYPVVVFLPKPICQEVGWWYQVPSIWESNSANLVIAQEMGFLSDANPMLNKVYYRPKVAEWSNPYVDYKTRLGECNFFENPVNSIPESVYTSIYDTEVAYSVLVVQEDLDSYLVQRR